MLSWNCAKVFVSAGNPDSAATIDTAGMLAYRANQTAEAKYTSLYMLYKWPTKTVCILDHVTFLLTLIQSVWEVVSVQGEWFIMPSVCRDGIGCFVFPIHWYRSEVPKYRLYISFNQHQHRCTCSLNQYTVP